MNLLARPLTVYLAAALMSLILSLYAALHIDVVNPDAICYLQSASAMQQGLHFAMHLCGQASWPLYSALIFLMVKLTHLGVSESAYLLNSIFSLISVLSFIAITQNLNKGNKVTVLWLAALVILTAHEFNALRQDVIRDHGFMAFYLLSILFLLNYFRSMQWRDSLGWSISLVVATLFRIEGAVFLLLLPFAVYLNPRLTFFGRFKSFLRLQTLVMIIAAMVIIWLFIHPSQDLSRLHDLKYQILNGSHLVWKNFSMRSALLAKNVLTADSVHDANMVFALSLLSWYVIQIISTLSLVYALLVIYAWWKRTLATDQLSRYVLWAYIIINLLITMVFLAERYFLSQRYLMPLSLVLMLWIPFALHYLMEQYRERKWLSEIALALILLSSLGGIFHFGYSKMYIRNAGEWISQNVPPQSKLYSNDYQLKYYSNHFGNELFAKDTDFSILKTLQWQQYDYLALRVSKQDPEISSWIEKEIQMSPMKVFANRRGDEVVIYKVPH